MVLSLSDSLVENGYRMIIVEMVKREWITHTFRCSLGFGNPDVQLYCAKVETPSMSVYLEEPSFLPSMDVVEEHDSLEEASRCRTGDAVVVETRYKDYTARQVVSKLMVWDWAGR